MIRQLKATLTDAKTNLERARYKQREIIAANQALRADNQVTGDMLASDLSCDPKTGL